MGLTGWWACCVFLCHQFELFFRATRDLLWGMSLAGWGRGQHNKFYCLSRDAQILSYPSLLPEGPAGELVTCWVSHCRSEILHLAAHSSSRVADMYSCHSLCALGRKKQQLGVEWHLRPQQLSLRTAHAQSMDCRAGEVPGGTAHSSAAAGKFSSIHIFSSEVLKVPQCKDDSGIEEFLAFATCQESFISMDPRKSYSPSRCMPGLGW